MPQPALLGGGKTVTAPGWPAVGEEEITAVARCIMDRELAGWRNDQRR